MKRHQPASNTNVAVAAPIPPTKACRIDRFGPPDVITLADVERPVPAATPTR